MAMPVQAPGSVLPVSAPRASSRVEVNDALLAREATGVLRPAPITGVSLVIPVFNEEGNLVELTRRITRVMVDVRLPYEVIFVDDGSTDATWRVVQDLATEHEEVKGLRHRRNFGKARGLSTGFAMARYDLVMTMDGDLQDDPDEIPRFIEQINAGNDLVSGWKQKRQDPLGKTLPSKLFNACVRRVSGVQLNDFNCGFKAYRGEVVRNIRLYGELHRFTPVLASAEGYKIAELPVTHHPRTWGKSKYGWSRLPKGFLDLLTVTFITNFRQRPMHLLGLPGLLTLALGIVIGLWLTAERVVFNSAIGNRPLLLLAVLLVVIGAQFFGLGLLGELLVYDANEPEGAARRAPLRETLGYPAGVMELTRH